MQERRQSKRTILSSKLVIKRLDGGDAEEIDIDVIDLSKSGIGFKCDAELSIDSMYEANLTIWTQEVLHTILEIVRIEKKNNDLIYGAVFVGMSEMDAFRIQTYQTVANNK